MSTHTPGPWGVTTLNGKPAVGQDSERGGLVAWGMTPADAAYIVRACNAHAGLLAACEAAYAVLQAVEPDARGTAHTAATWTIRDAIATARGQKGRKP